MRRETRSIVAWSGVIILVGAIGFFLTALFLPESPPQEWIVGGLTCIAITLCMVLAFVCIGPEQ